MTIQINNQHVANDTLLFDFIEITGSGTTDGQASMVDGVVTIRSVYRRSVGERYRRRIPVTYRLNSLRDRLRQSLPLAS